MKKKIMIFFLISLLALTINLTHVKMAYAINDLLVETVVDSTKQSGSTFGVFVNISDGAAVSGWQIFIRFNRTVDNSNPLLNCTAIWLSTYTTGAEITRINNDEGWLAAGRSAGGEEVYGPGWLAYLEFVVLGYGSTDIAFDDAYTRILDSNIQPQPFTTTDGYFRNKYPGDVDGDKYVGSADFSVLAGAYGLSLGNPSYNREADFDFDGYIGSADFSALAGNYGITFP